MEAAKEVNAVPIVEMSWPVHIFPKFRLRKTEKGDIRGADAAAVLMGFSLGDTGEVGDHIVEHIKTTLPEICRSDIQACFLQDLDRRFRSAVGKDFQVPWYERGAFTAVLLYRFSTFYTPPIWGFFSLKWLERNRYL